MGRRSAHRLVGRQQDVQRVRAALMSLEQGEGGLLLVQGEPGIGKTRLLDEADELAREAGFPVLLGRAGGIDLAGGAMPYGLVSELLLDVADSAEHARPGALADHGWSALAEVLPLAGVSASVPASSVDRLRVFACVRQFLQALNREVPLVLLVDDLHWADSPSLDVLSYVAEAFARRPLMVMVTFWPPSRADVQRTVAQLVRSARADLLTLDPLTSDEILDQLRQLTGDELGEPEVGRITALSGGIPLFVEELAASGHAEQLPSRLGVVLGNRLAGTSVAARRILGTAALHPRPVDAGALGRVTGLTRAEVLEALGEGVDRGMLEALPDGTYRFHHALLQRSVADALTALDQQEGHRAWARWFETLAQAGGASWLSIIAYHWYHSGDADEALPALVRAGSEAHRLGGLAEAATHWSNALGLWPRAHAPAELTGMDRDTLVALLDETYEASSQWEAGRRLIEAEERLGEPDPVKRLWIRLRRELIHDFLGLAARPAVDPADYEQVLSDLETAVLVSPSRMLAACLLLLGNNDPAVSLDFHLRRLSAVQEVAKRAGDRQLQAHALDITADQLRFHGDLAAAVQAGRQAVRLAEDTAPAEVDWYRGDILASLIDLGLAREAAREGEGAVGSAALEDAPGRGWYLPFTTACAHIALGGLGRARELLEPLREYPSEPVRATVLYELARVELSHGNAAAADALIAQADSLETSQWWVVDARGAMHGWLHVCQGAVEMAHKDLLPVLSTVERYPKWVMLAAATRRPESDVPADWIQALEDAVQRLPREGPVAAATRAQVAAHLASIAGRDDPVIWSRAVALWAEVGYPDPEAWCRLRYVEALLPERRFEEAERELRAVIDIATRLPCGLLADEATALARRARLTVTPSEHRADADAVLTAREQEVLILLAHGKTNNEIATDLFMSPKTASVHISRILHKLGATNRTEAAWHAHQLGLD